MVETNAEAGINRLTEPNQILQPNQGVYLLIYYVVTTNTHKLNLACTFDVPEGIPCGHWDATSGQVLAHPAFQPFDWPPMTEQSPPYVDIKIKVKGQILLHVILKSFRSRTDMTVQKCWIDEAILMNTDQDLFSEIQVQHTIFAGYDICSHTFEAGQRVYSLGPNGTVVALSKPRAHVEVRKVLWGSVDFHGHEPDRFEYKFSDVLNAMFVATNRLTIPPSWIVLSNISGPACATIIQEGRNAGAVAQAPDQHMQFGQIAAVHSPWFPGSTADVGSPSQPPVVHRVRMSGDQVQNKHIIVSGVMEFINRSVVAGDALALGGHDENLQAPAIVIPPAMGMGLSILAAPSGADDPNLAVDLPPLIQLTRPQIQPDMAKGTVLPEADPNTAFQRPAPLERQTPVQSAGSTVRPAVAEMFPEPVFPKTIDERRIRAIPKALPPPRPIAPIIERLSAPTSIQQLMVQNMALMGGQSQASGSNDPMPGTAPAPTRGGRLLALSDGAAAQWQAGKTQQAIVEGRIEEFRQFQISQTRQVEEFRKLLNDADPGESDAYRDHIRKLLGREEARLQDAFADLEKLHKTAAALEDQLAEIMATAQPQQ